MITAVLGMAALLTRIALTFIVGTYWLQEGWCVSWCDGLTLDGCQVPAKAALLVPLLSWTGEGKYNKRLMGWDNSRERSLSNYSYG